MKIEKYFVLFVLIILTLTQTSYAIEVAPRISDREIIESLSELKAGQKALNQRFDAQNKSINQRFDAQNKSINQRFVSFEKRFTGLEKRFDSFERSINQQFDRLWTLMLVFISGIFVLIGYSIWDRKATLRPLEKRMDALEKELQRDLELRHDKGSLLTRLLQALRELAKKDEKLAGVLRSFSLL